MLGLVCTHIEKSQCLSIDINGQTIKRHASSSYRLNCTSKMSLSLELKFLSLFAQSRHGNAATEPLIDHDQCTALPGVQPSCCCCSASKNVNQKLRILLRIDQTFDNHFPLCVPEVFTTSGSLSQRAYKLTVCYSLCLDVMSKQQGNKHI